MHHEKRILFKLNSPSRIIFGVVLDLRQRIVELKLPSSEDRMYLIMSSVSTLLVIAHTEAYPNLASIPMV